MKFPTCKSLSAILLTVLLASAISGCGEENDGATAARTSDSSEAAASLSVDDPWVRATTGTEDATMSAAFMLLDNTGDTEITVTGASTELAGRTELHEMAAVDGKMVMRQIDGGLPLSPGRGQLLQPGGSHVMLMELTGELSAGDEVELTLELSDGSQVTVTAPVKTFTEEGGHYHGEGQDDDGHSHDEGRSEDDHS